MSEPETVNPLAQADGKQDEPEDPDEQEDPDELRFCCCSHSPFRCASNPFALLERTY